MRAWATVVAVAFALAGCGSDQTLTSPSFHPIRTDAERDAKDAVESFLAAYAGHDLDAVCGSLAGQPSQLFRCDSTPRVPERLDFVVRDGHEYLVDSGSSNIDVFFDVDFGRPVARRGPRRVSNIGIDVRKTAHGWRLVDVTVGAAYL